MKFNLHKMKSCSQQIYKRMMQNSRICELYEKLAHVNCNINNQIPESDVNKQ